MSKQVNLLRSLEAVSKMLPGDVMLELSRQSQMFQNIVLQRLSISIEQVQYLQRYGAEIAQMQKTYSRLHKVMRPLIEAYPQLEMIKTGLNVPLECQEDQAEETQDDLCVAAQQLVDNVLERGVSQDKTPDVQTIHDVIFSASYYALTLPPQKFIAWLKQSRDALLASLKAAGGETLSGLFNTYGLYKLAVDVCGFVARVL